MEICCKCNRYITDFGMSENQDGTVFHVKCQKPIIPLKTMIKHKKILKNFNFPKLVAVAIKKHPDLGKRIERFNEWREVSKTLGYELSIELDIIKFNNKKYCFELNDSLIIADKLTELNTTSSEKCCIGDYIYNNYDWLLKA